MGGRGVSANETRPAGVLAPTRDGFILAGGGGTTDPTCLAVLVPLGMCERPTPAPRAESRAQSAESQEPRAEPLETQKNLPTAEKLRGQTKPNMEGTDSDGRP